MPQWASFRSLLEPSTTNTRPISMHETLAWNWDMVVLSPQSQLWLQDSKPRYNWHYDWHGLSMARYYITLLLKIHLIYWGSRIWGWLESRDTLVICLTCDTWTTNYWWMLCCPLLIVMTHVVPPMVQFGLLSKSNRRGPVKFRGTCIFRK